MRLASTIATILLPIAAFFSLDCTTSPVGDDGPPGDGDGDAPDAGVAEPDAALGNGPIGPDFDYTNAVWTLTDVSQSDGTLSHGGRLGFAGGQTQILYSEPASDELSDQDIVRASLDGDDWSSESLTPAVTTQLAFPSITSNDGVFWYSWIGRANASDINDVWVMSPQSGGQFSQPVNLTNGFGGRQVRNVGVIPVGAGGILAFHLSATGVPNQTILTISHLTSDGVAFSTDVSPPFEATCRNIRTGSGLDGRLEMLMTCSPGSIIHVTFLDNLVALTEIPTDGVQADAADFAYSGDRAFHVVWSGTADCPEGRCRGVYYSRNLGVPVQVSELPGRTPVIATNGFSNPVIAFHVNSDVKSVMISHSSDTVNFAEPRALPNDGNQDSFPSDLKIEFGSGRPHLLFDRVFDGTDPLNSEVIHATVL